MAITVKKIVLWRKEIENKPGVLADVLQPIAAAGADLQVVMGYRYPSDETKAALEVYPVAGKKSIAAAQAAGLVTAPIPTLLVDGDNRAGVGAVVARAMADAGINIGFLVAQVIGRKYSAVIGFDSDADASKATTLIKKATASKRK